MASIENSLKYEAEVEPGKIRLITSGEFVRATTTVRGQWMGLQKDRLRRIEATEISDENERRYKMKMTKLIVTMAAVLTAAVGQSGDSVPLLLDTVTPSTAPVVDSLSLQWDAAWIGDDTNATVVIADNGTEVRRATGTGELLHAPNGTWRHDLTYTTYIDGVIQSEIYTTTVYTASAQLKYNVVDDRAVITEAIQTSGAIAIPSVIDGYPVNEIPNGVFSGHGELTSVTIPDSVTSIGDSAFSGCSGLTSVTIPECVPSFSTTAFDGCDKLWTAWYRTLANSSAAGAGVGDGSASVVTTIVQNVEAPYSLTNAVADHAIASVTVDADCAIDSFVLKDGKVYDSVLYISNTADHAVTLTLPSGYVYKAIKGARPLEIPASSQSILSITRVANNVFLVSREDLETIQ